MKSKEEVIERWEEDKDGKMVRTDNMSKSFKEKKLEELQKKLKDYDEVQFGTMKVININAWKNDYKGFSIKQLLSDTIDATLNEVEKRIEDIFPTDKGEELVLDRILLEIKELKNNE